MKFLADANFLLALTADIHAHHSLAHRWWTEHRAGAEVGICRPMQSALLRLLCTSAVMGAEAKTLTQAWSIYAVLIDSGCFFFAPEPSGLVLTWERLCRPYGSSPKVVMDAYLAAFAQCGGYTLVSFDRAFSHFKGLKWLCPGA